MEKSKTLTIAGLIGAVILIGILIGWLGSGGFGTHRPPVDSTLTSATNGGGSHTVVEVNPRTAGTTVTTVPKTNPAGFHPGPDVTSVTPSPSNVMTNWEDVLEEILLADTPDTNKVKQLLAMFPRLPDEGKIEVSQHLSNLVEDDDYAPLKDILADPTMPDDVLDTLLADLLNRPDKDKLPMLLQLAQTPNHPKAAESKEMLELYLDEDYGTDWKRWRAAMEKYLKENPE